MCDEFNQICFLRTVSFTGVCISDVVVIAFNPANIQHTIGYCLLFSTALPQTHSSCMRVSQEQVKRARKLITCTKTNIIPGSIKKKLAEL